MMLTGFGPLHFTPYVDCSYVAINSVVLLRRLEVTCINLLLSSLFDRSGDVFKQIIYQGFNFICRRGVLFIFVVFVVE